MCSHAVILLTFAEKGDIIICAVRHSVFYNEIADDNNERNGYSVVLLLLISVGFGIS